jgi:hypothetical protein
MRSDRPETCQRPASCGKVLEQLADGLPAELVTLRAAVVGGFSAGGLRHSSPSARPFDER